MEERIKTLLANGLKASEVASIVGCSPGYISQLIKKEGFAEEILALKIESSKDKTEEDHIDTRVQTLEHKLLNSIEESLAESSLGEKTKLWEVINKRRDSHYARKHPILAPANQVTNVQIVSLAMPTQAVKQMGPVVELNKMREIIAIDNQPLAPMSSDGVKNLFEQITAASLIKDQAQLVSEM